jgi:hypothetical protein
MVIKLSSDIKNISMNEFIKELKSLIGKKVYLQNMMKVKDSAGVPWDATTVLSHITIEDVFEDDIYIVIYDNLEENCPDGIRENSIRLRKKYINPGIFLNPKGLSINVDSKTFLNVINIFPTK